MNNKERIKSIFYAVFIYVFLYVFLTIVTGVPLYLQPLGFAAVNIIFIGGMLLNQIVLFFIEFEDNDEDKIIKCCPYCGNKEVEVKVIMSVYHPSFIDACHISCSKCKQSCYAEGPYVSE